MFTFNKTETINFNEFMAGTWNERKGAKQPKFDVLIPLGVLPLTMAFDTTPAHAGAIADRIAGSFDPIIELAQGVSYPLTFLMITGGFILIIVGQKSRGLQMMKWASVGFIGLQFAPAIMDILQDAGNAMRGQ